MHRIITVAALLALLGCPGAVQAVPVLWTLSDVTFDDGGTASGSFVFDADTVAFSAVNVVTTDGAVLVGTTYGFAHPGFPDDPNRLVVIDALVRAVGIHAMALALASPMTNAGGVIPLTAGPLGPAFGIEGLCETADCFAVDPLRLLTAGEVRADAVPEPAALLLVSLGVAAAARRRQLVSQAVDRPSSVPAVPRRSRWRRR